MGCVKEAESLSLLFITAGLEDLFDVFLHFGIAQALFRHLGHNEVVGAENLSMGCAIISTVCAVLGEVISHRIRTRRATPPETSAISEATTQ